MAWELVPDTEHPVVQRLAVPGGWIYEMEHMRPTQVFVPEPQGEKVQIAMELTEGYAEGYNKGYEDAKGEKVPAYDRYRALLVDLFAYAPDPTGFQAEYRRAWLAVHDALEGESNG